MAYDNGEVTIHTGIRVRVIESRDGQPHEKSSTRRSVAALISEIVPRGLSFKLVNKTLDREGALGTSSTLATACTATRRPSSSQTVCVHSATSMRRARASRSAWTTWSSRRPKRSSSPRRRPRCSRSFDQYQEGLITDGERYNKIVDIWAGRCRQGHAGDDARHRQRDDRRSRDQQRDHRAVVQPDLHHGGLRRARQHAADSSARRHAWPHGQAVG